MGRAAYVNRIAALFLVATLAVACGGGGTPPTLSPTQTSRPDSSPTATPTPSPPTATPTPTPPPSTDHPPDRDLIDLARRYRGLPQDTPRTVRDEPFGHRVGDRQEFTILDIDVPALRTITATVRLVTARAYFFMEEGVDVDPSVLERIGNDFDSMVYPGVTAAFGREWSPGVDGDTRITIVHAGLRGAGGYVSASDEFPRSAVPRSNEREAIYLDASFLNSTGAAYNAVLAHELQHLIHWNADGSEEAWVNEGLSQVAAELAGGGTSSVGAFLATPDTQLTDWPLDSAGVHYGESQLFIRYLLDRFGGRENAAALLAVPENGIAGVNSYLQDFDTTFQDVFAEWVVANYLDEDSGPYAHQGADSTVATFTTIGEVGEGSGSVHQFAADYLEIDPPAGGATFSLDGSDQVTIGIAPQDGAFWWSNAGDSIDSRLTREFDLTGLASATLRFRAWFETERGWDYAYVAASRDGGATWQALPGRHTTDYDPIRLAYGPGYTGSSDGWVMEEVDLNAYAGGEVLIRFEYVTDDAAHARGFAVDDIVIPELGFADGADGEGGWWAEGFRRIDGPLPQRFVVQLIQGSGPSAVQRLEVGPGNRVEVPLDAPATVVVAAVTEGTTEIASYRWSLRAP